MNVRMDASGVKREIKEAKELFTEKGRELLSDKELGSLLKEYRDAISKTTGLMLDVGISRACASCAAGKVESCCFEGAEEWYGRVLLLVNLLMGINPPSSPEKKGQCLFNGREGCRLRARYSYCINYLCPELNASLGPAAVTRFLSTAGIELALGWEVERRVIKLLGEKAR